MDTFTQKIDMLMQENLYRVFPAASVCILHQGKTLVEQSWGTLDPETRTTPATNQTLFDLASVTKLFTVSAFLAQVSENRVTLETPLAAIIPEFAAQNPRGIDGGIDPFTKEPLPTDPRTQGQTVIANEVTFWHLLTHTSGLAAWRDIYNAAGAAPSPALDLMARRERWQKAVAAMCTAPFVSQPGQGVRYSDLGLMLLGEAVSRLDHAPLDEVIKKRVTQPLELSSIQFLPLLNVAPNRIAPTEDDPLWRKRRCWGEVHDENACGVGGIAGHAGLFGTARDIAAFGQAWLTYNARLGINRDLMHLATQEQAVTDGERRGLGWMLRSVQGSSAGDQLDQNTYGHTGFTGTSLFIDPTRQLVIALLTNYVYYGRDKERILQFRRAFHNMIGEAIPA